MKTEIIHVRVAPDLRNRLDKAATREGVTRSDIIVHAVLAYLRQSDEAAWARARGRGLRHENQATQT